MESSTNNFSYSPLNHSKGEIRLINLQPSTDFSADLRCDIFYCSIDQHPEYEALSYQWGNPNETTLMFLDGTEFGITLNLDKALRHLRCADKPRILWIDAICINQSSIQERGEQVSLMGQIYKSSSTDLLWMGEDDGQSVQLIQLLGTLRKMENMPPSEIISIAEELLGPGVERVLQDRNPEEETQNFVLSAFETIQCRMVMESMINWDMVETIASQFIKFREASVWNRIWIVQEIVLAAKVSIVFGSHEFPIFSVWILQNCFTLMQSASETSGPRGLSGRIYWDSDSAQKTIRLRYDMRRGRPATLLKLWSRFGRFGATDPRDQIFALLSLAVERLEIVPNYTQSIEDLFIDVTRKLIVANGNLDILDIGFGRIGIEPSERVARTLSNRPSWLPQFDVLDIIQSPFVNDARLLTRGFSAGLISSTKLDHDKILTPKDSSILCLSGFIVAPVVRILEALEGPIWPPRYHMLFENVVSIIGPEFQDIFDEPFIDVYWKTLTCDQMHRRSISSPSLPLEDLDVFQALARKLSTKEGQKDASSDEIDLFFHTLESLHVCGKFGLVQDYLPAMLPHSCLQDDLVCIFYGGKSPMVIRKCWEDEYGEMFRFIGPAYLHGFMDGEALVTPEDLQEGGMFEEREFRLL